METIEELTIKNKKLEELSSQLLSTFGNFVDMLDLYCDVHECYVANVRQIISDSDRELKQIL